MRLPFTASPLVGAVLSAALLACQDHAPPTDPKGGGPEYSTWSLTVERAQPWTIDDEFARIAREEVPGFAGHHFDENGNSVVWLTDLGQRAAVEAWVARLRRGKRLAPAPVSLRQANYDFIELKEWRDRLVAFVLARPEVFSLDIDETENRLKIGVKNDAAREIVKVELAALTIPMDAVTAVIERPPELLLTLRDRARPVRGGFQIFNPNRGTCTLGFNALQGGKRVFVTASHCSDTQYGLDNSGQWQPSTPSPSDTTNLIGREVKDVPLYRCHLFAAFPCRLSDASIYGHNAQSVDDLGYIARTTFIGWGAPGSIEVDPNSPFFCD